MWVATQEMPRTGAHPFYTRLNQILATSDHRTALPAILRDEGRPGLPPGRYFRLLLIGYFEGLDSERAIAWRAADSFALREFLGAGVARSPARSLDDLAHASLDRSRDA